MNAYKQSESRHEDHPAGGGVQETFRELWLDTGQHSCQRNAACVGDNGNRNRGKKKYHSQAGSLLEEIAINQAQKTQRKQRTDTAAGFHYEELAIGKFENIPVRQDGDLQ